MYAITMLRCIINYTLPDLVQNISSNWEALKKLLPGIYLHRGRTDTNGGHRDRLNRTGWGIGSYHYHHKLPAHLHPNGKCPYEGKKASSIINPYTGTEVNIGVPYIFDDNSYFSLNLVSKSLTADDKLGVTPNSNTGGAFYACPTGDSSKDNLGEEFSFIYPKDLLGLKDNKIFETNDGKLQLLATSDGNSTTAYITLENIGAYMTKDGYFTDFFDNGSGVWSFKVRKPTVHITFPNNSTPSFSVGDTLIVKANIDKVACAKLIAGQHIESKDNLLNQSEVIFSGFTLTNGDIGNSTLKVEVNTGGTAVDAKTVTSAVQIQIESSEKPAITDDWLRLYSNPTVPGTGRTVAKHINANNYDWGMGEEAADINTEARKQIVAAGGIVVTNKENNNLFSDTEGRYWVAVGPRVVEKTVNLNKELQASDFKYGTKLDIVVLDETTSTTYYIPAVLGDIKAHSWPDGLYQTGKYIPSGVLEVGYDDGSSVEFIGSNILKDSTTGKSSVNITNNYRLISMIVYDGVVNY